MTTEEKKATEAKTEGKGFGCCNPENFEKMFEMMGKYCQGLLSTPLIAYEMVIYSA